MRAERAARRAAHACREPAAATGDRAAQPVPGARVFGRAGGEHLAQGLEQIVGDQGDAERRATFVQDAGRVARAEATAVADLGAPGDVGDLVVEGGVDIAALVAVVQRTDGAARFAVGDV